MPPTKAEVFEKIQEALVDALGVEDDEVTPEATMVGDLGAESINAQYVQDGKVTDEGLAELKVPMPFADLTKFEANPVVQEFGNLLTVSDLCRYVETKVDATD